MVDIAGPGVGLEELSERGHVTFTQLDGTINEYRAYRWYRGETVPLTPDEPDGVGSWPAALTDDGVVVGASFDFIGRTGQRGFVWRDGVTTWITDSPGDEAVVDIDDRGRLLIGRAPDGAGNGLRAALLVDGQEVTSPLVLDGNRLQPIALGGRGAVLGVAYDPTTEERAIYLWRPGRTPVDIGDLGAGAGSATQINDEGIVIGFTGTTAGYIRMFRWRHGRIVDLGTLGGDVTNQTTDWGGRPDLLNDRGDVAGSSQTPTGEFHAFLWRHGHMRDLGTLGGAQSFAYGINDHGDVVGTSETAHGGNHAFLWRDGIMYDLGALTGADPDTDSTAIAINDRGQVLGYSDGRGVLWSTGRSQV